MVPVSGEKDWSILTGACSGPRISQSGEQSTWRRGEANVEMEEIRQDQVMPGQKQ